MCLLFSICFLISLAEINARENSLTRKKQAFRPAEDHVKNVKRGDGYYGKVVEKAAQGEKDNNLASVDSEELPLSDCHQQEYGAFTDFQISQANKLLKKNCERKGDNNSCQTLGKFYLIRMHRDTTKAKSFFDIACARNHLSSCYRSNMILEKSSFSLAKQKYSDLCDLGHRDSCHRLGGILENNNPQEARIYFTKGCNLQNGMSCVRAAELASSNMSANSFLTKGCQAGSSIACQLKQLNTSRSILKKNNSTRGIR